MHTTENGEDCKVGEKNVGDVHEQSCPFPAYPASQNEQTSAATPGRPPMTVVVINGSTESSMTGHEDSQRNWSFISPPAIVSMGSTEESKSSWQISGSINGSLGTAPSPFSSYKLKPRNPFQHMEGPGRGIGGARGRKRPAHSISIPVGSVSSADSSLRPPRPCFHGKEEDATDASFSKLDSISPGSEITPKDSSLSPDCLNLKSLSLRSPRKTFESARGSPSLYGNQLSASRSTAHSFSMYAPSPVGSVMRDANTATSSSSSFMASRTPCSSTKSSPRHVPLTILSHGNFLNSPSKSSMLRPPLHGGGSSLLFSLDHDEIDSEDEVGAQGKTWQAPASSNSSISSEETERKLPSFSSPGVKPSPMVYLSPSRTTDRKLPTLTSPNVKTTPIIYPSPSKTAASILRTPLPRITLTPRSPQSSGSARRTRLPMFPSSPSDDDIDALSVPQAHDSIDDAMDKMLHGFRGQHGRSSAGYMQPMEPTKNPVMRTLFDSSNSLALSTDGSKGEIMCLDRSKRDDSLLSLRSSMYSDTGDRPTLPKARDLSTPVEEHFSAPRLDRRVSENVSLPSEPFQKAPTAAAETRITVSGHDGFLWEMMNGTRGAATETGSLSDSDDEDAFVLHCPHSENPSLEASDANRRPKKRRDFYETHYNRESCTSMTSGVASTNSLFGMDFYLEEGQSMASSTNRSPTPFANLSFNNRNPGSSGALSIKDGDDTFVPPELQRSVHSFGSLGLCLDGPSASMEEHWRDLVTPPATMHAACSPPPLPARDVPDEPIQAFPK